MNSKKKFIFLYNSELSVIIKTSTNKGVASWKTNLRSLKINR